MRSRLYDFSSDTITVHYDAVRCIHVEACVRSLPSVFNPSRRPWIDPSLASADQAAEACERCPTGALHYTRKDGGAAEATPTPNQILICSDGPLYARGNVHIIDPEGATILKDTRVGLCRCGRTHNRPLCDGSHNAEDFRADGRLSAAAMTHASSPTDVPDEAPLILQLTRDRGPLMIHGPTEIRGDRADRCLSVRIGALCCCGRSKNKPFCDGSHAEI